MGVLEELYGFEFGTDQRLSGHLCVPGLMRPSGTRIDFAAFPGAERAGLLSNAPLGLRLELTLSGEAREAGLVETGDAGDGCNHHAGKQLHGGNVAFVEGAGR